MTSIVNKMERIRLRWFGHVIKRNKSEAIRTIMNIDGRSGRRRPKKRLDMSKNAEDYWYVRKTCRRSCRLEV